MAPKYKLTYFNVRARGEVIRMMFAYGGIEYEDIRHEIGTDAWKAHTPFGQLPTLEIDGKVFAQSNAIGRYVAREVGLDGKTSLEKLEVDMIVDTLEDLMQVTALWWREQDPARKETMLKKIKEESVPKLFGKIDEIIAKNGGFTAGKSISFSDFMTANLVHNLAGIYKDIDFNKFRNVQAVKDKVHNLPKVKEWVQRRPESMF